MEVLVIGGSGFVGKTVTERMEIKDVAVLSHQELDITDPDSVRQNMKASKADVVVNYAAFTNVKAAAVDPKSADVLNIDGVGYLTEACRDMDKYLIQVSTDGVFPITGEHKGPHPEDEIPIDDPVLVSAYGLTKLRGERKILESRAKTAILRIAYPFGNASVPDKDYAIKLIKTIKAGCRLFLDQYLSSTYIPSLAAVIDILSAQKLTGVFHWVCGGLFTPFEMASYVNDKLGLGLEIKKGSLAKLEQEKGKQVYAMYGGLSTKLTEEKLGLKPPTWQEAIDDFTPKLKPAVQALLSQQ